MLELSRAFRLLLLERAVLTVYQVHGMPLTDAAERWFDGEVDAVYRAFLVARRSAPPRSFASAARAEAVRQCYLRKGCRAKT
jgi:hypothetical protein